MLNEDVSYMVINVLIFCHLATYQINFVHRRLLPITERRSKAFIFHLTKFPPVSAPLPLSRCKNMKQPEQGFRTNNCNSKVFKKGLINLLMCNVK